MVENNINTQLLAELEQKYELWKNNAGLKYSLDELDSVFFIRDYIIASKYVSPALNRMICARIRDTFGSWVQVIHNWLIPSPYNIISNSEGQLFTDSEKEELNIILKEFMAFISENAIIGLKKDTKREGEYVNKSIMLFNKHLPRMIYYSEKVHDYWNSSSDKKEKR
ncbi:MAG: hypothetical protein ACP5N3_03545 [Candidatus Nanoarchaeia archaeon]